jgi:Lipase maturation factor
MNAGDSAVSEKEADVVFAVGKLRPTYWLTRFVILRLLGLVYLVAFVAAAQQIVPLIGHGGLLPADLFLQRVSQHFGSVGAGFQKLPSLFWWNVSDAWLSGVAWVGVGLSAIVLCGYANSVILLALWALYMSIIHVGQLWYSYGWETQLLETGFIAVFLCPLFDPRPFARMPPSIVALWIYRWLIFRIMLGAGLIKMRGDDCWRDLTALYYHYETQPVPNPLSRFLHFAPHWFQKFGVLWNHFVELIVPWFGFGPGMVRNGAGVLMASFMGALIVTGNLSFLNWLTIVPCLACIDDSVWRRVLPRFLVNCAANAERTKKRSRLSWVAGLLFAVVVVWLSIEPVKNLVSPHQAMNASFDTLHLVNTYGAFGTVGRERYEIVFEGTEELLPTESAKWREYEFKVKPGDLNRRPAIITPYHHRLDWQIWFAAIPNIHYDLRTLPTPQNYPWVVTFVWKLLHNNPGTLSLIASNPFPEKPPKYVRALVYRYKFAPLDNADGAWWTRERVGTWLPAMSSYTPEMRRFIESSGLMGRDAD